MYLFSFSTATVLLLYNTLVSILHPTFGMFSVQSNYYHQWQFFCNKKFVLQENNRYKTYERESRILERKVSIISHGSNSEPVPINVPQNEPDSTYKHSVDSFMHSSLCPPPKQASLGSSLSHWGSVRIVTTCDLGGNPPNSGVQGPAISKEVHQHQNDQLAYHLWISAVSMLQCMVSLSTGCSETHEW